MLYVSDKAKQRILDIREKDGLTDHHFVRVTVESGGCSGLSYKIEFDDKDKPDDQAFEDNGMKIVTNIRSFLYLCNTTLDFSSGLEGKGFYFDNPNASRSCGCGESFSV